MIEGNRLAREEVSSVIGRGRHFPGRERDEAEVLGYYAAIERLERFAAQGGDITDLQVRTLHALVMAGGKAVKKATPYRRAERDPRRRQPPDRLHAPGGRRRPPAHGEFLDWLRPASARASRARSAPGSPTTSSPRSTPTTTATAAWRGS